MKKFYGFARSPVSAGGDIDGRVEQLLASAQHGGTVVYSGQSPPGSGVQDDGVPPSAEAAAQRSEWIDEVDNAVRFEDLEAVSSGTYALEPPSLTQGLLIPYPQNNRAPAHTRSIAVHR